MKLDVVVHKTLNELVSHRQRRAFLKSIAKLVDEGTAKPLIIKSVVLVDMNESMKGFCWKCEAETNLWQSNRRRWVCRDCIKTKRFTKAYTRIRESKTHCEQCGLAEWRSIKLWLHIHHVDGNKENNNEENLRVLCPNCHEIEHVIKSNT